MAEITGGCLCGAVRYSTSAAPSLMANCHCTDCQKSSGGAFACVLALPENQVKFEKGGLKWYEKKGDSGNAVRRGFCQNCGSQIASTADAMPGAILLKAGTIDDGKLYQPQMVLYTDSKQSWVTDPSGIPHFPGMPQG